MVVLGEQLRQISVKHVVQGCRDKVAAFDEVCAELDVPLAQTVFVGDDVPDLALLRHAGFSIAVANAVAEVRSACDAVTQSPGGFGAVREVCEMILAAAD